MKLIFLQMAIFLATQSNKRSLRFILRFSFGLLFVIGLYTGLFHYLMLEEGQEYSLITGLYWTLTVMSTLGFGDITFTTDLGRLFSIIVLFSGIVMFMLIMPFAFIRFIYQPWLDAHSKSILPKSLPDDIERHVLLVGSDDMAQHLAQSLGRYKVPCYMIEQDFQTASSLFDQGQPVMRGDFDRMETYQAARVENARMVVALHDDMKNTNIAATISGFSPSTLLVSRADNENSIDILHLAGCKHVFHFANMLGEAMGRRVFIDNMESNIIARFEELCIAEAPVHSNNLVGKTLRALNLRAKLGVNIVGIWSGSDFRSSNADTILEEGMVILLAGTADKLEGYDRFATAEISQNKTNEPPVVVIGGGRVGQAVISTLERRMLSFRLIDKRAEVIKPDDERFILGDAEDIHTIRKAGIENAHTVIITTHSDDLNIYLTLYCRKLNPAAKIISRSNLSRNIRSLYTAGASIVMASSSMATNTLINLISPDSIYMLTEGLNVFRMAMPPSLLGKNLITSNIRQSTHCNVVGLRREGKMQVNMSPELAFEAGDELLLIGSNEAALEFMKKFPGKYI